MKTFYIFDTSNLFYRAVYSEPLVTSTGMQVQALHGFIRMANYIITQHKPDYIIFALEGGNQLRKNLDSNYKANRPPISDEIRSQKDMMPRLLDSMGYPYMSCPGYEADDLVNAMVKIGLENGLKPVIVSSDKDFNVLLKNNVSMYDIGKDTFITESDVYNKYGVTVDQFEDYLSICGDSADNISGVKGVGPKGAQQALTQFGSLAGIYDNLHNLKPSVAQKFSLSKDAVLLAKELVRLRTPDNLPADFKIENCIYVGHKEKELRSILRELEFKELEQILLGSQVIEIEGLAIGVRL